MADLLTRLCSGSTYEDKSSPKVWRLIETRLPYDKWLLAKREEFDLIGKLRSGEIVYAGSELISESGNSRFLADEGALDIAERYGFDYALVTGDMTGRRQNGFLAQFYVNYHEFRLRAQLVASRVGNLG